MRLIDADELKRKYAGWYNVYGKNKSIRCVEVKEIDWMPTIDAVPLNKLCEWLAGNAWHLDCSDCDCEHCDCPQLHDDSGNSPEFWKTKLLKWMEKQNE